MAMSNCCQWTSNMRYWSQIVNFEEKNMLLQGQTVANVHQPLWQRQTVVNEHQIQNWSQIVNYEKNMLLQCQTVAKVHKMPHWS